MTKEGIHKIKGELTPDPHICKFHVDLPLVEPGWTVVFNGPEQSQGSRLADVLFAIEGIVQVRVKDSEITLRKDSSDPWPEVAGLIVPAIREAMNGEEKPVSALALDAVRNASMDDVGPMIERLFEESINPALSSHGGYARLVRVEDRDVFLEMGGGCQGCSASQATLRYGIENAIRQIAPQVRDVIDVTDHTAGTNPFYAS